MKVNSPCFVLSSTRFTCQSFHFGFNFQLPFCSAIFSPIPWRVHYLANRSPALILQLIAGD